MDDEREEFATPCVTAPRRLFPVLALPLLAVALVLLSPQTASAQFGNVTVSNTPVQMGTGATPTATIMWSHTIPDSANRLLVVTVAIHRTGGTLAQVSSITYGAAGLTLSVSSVGQAQNGSARTEIWILVAPSIGTDTITVNLNAAANAVVASYSLASVDQAAPTFHANAGGSQAAPSNNATSTAEAGPLFGDPTKYLIIEATATSGSTTIAHAYSGQTYGHNIGTTDPNTTDQLKGSGGVLDGPIVTTNNLPHLLTPSDHWSCSCITANPAQLTDVGLQSFEATTYSGTGIEGRSGGVTMTWRAGMEANNLGYRVYRERDGVRTLITRDLIAGSGLFTPHSLSSGYRYGTYDRDGRVGDLYYLEDVDFSGKGTFHGPYVSTQSAGKASLAADSPTISEINDASSISHLVWAEDLARANGKGGAGAGGNAPGGANTQFQLANAPAIKLGVRETGWYRISPATLASNGVNLGSVDPRTFRIYNGGREIAIRVIGEADGRFDAGDAIEFYGTAIDSQASDTQVYWLTAATGNGLRMKVQPRGSAGGSAISFPAVAELKERRVYFASLENGERENFFGKVVSATPADHALTVSNIDPGGANAIVEVGVQGVTLVPHRVIVTVNGQSIGEIAFADKKAGFARISIPQSLLVEGANTVSLATAANADPADVSLVDSIRIGYTHKAAADQNLAVVNITGRTGARTIDGFSNNQVRAFDVTNPAAVQEIVGTVARTSNGYGITVQPGVSARRMLVATPDRALVPSSITVNRPSTWNAASNGANVVYITHRDFAASVAPLKALRESQGYSVAIVDVEDLFDEFSNGVESPAAIRAFVAHARSTWSVKPSFVTLVGDGSLDPKNYLGAGDFSFVPSKLIDASAIEMASDDWLVDGNGDDLPDVAVGRLPVRTAGEASAMIAKIIAFESAGTVNRTAMLVSDQTDISDFAQTTTDILSLLPTDYVVSQIQRGNDTDQATRQAVQTGANAGPGIVNFIGHGSIDVWRGNLMNATDAGTLGNAGRLSVYVAGNCLNGYYQDPNLESLGEALLKAPNGAVAVWASSGATGPEGQRVLLGQFYRSLFAGQPITIGQAAAQAKAAAAGDVRRSWVLLGDAATRLH